MNESDPAQHSDSGHSALELIKPASPLAGTRRIWTCFVYPLLGVFLAVLFQAIMAVVLAFVMLADGAESDDLSTRLVERIMQPDMFILTIISGQLGLLLITIVPWLFSKESFSERFGFRPVRHPAKVYGYTLSGSIFVLAISLGLVYLVVQLIPADESLGDFFGAVTPGWGVLFVLVISLFPGFIEEMLFRGYIQQRFQTRWKPWLAIVVASVLFALVHITPHGIAVALPLGLWFGFISWRVGSIWPTVACHAFVNGGLNTWRLIVKFTGMEEATVNMINLGFVAIGLVGFVLACRFLLSPQFAEPTAQT